MRMRNEANGGPISSRMDMRDMRDTAAAGAADGAADGAGTAPHHGATDTATTTTTGTGTGTDSSQQRKGPCKRKHRHWALHMTVQDSTGQYRTVQDRAYRAQLKRTATCTVL